MGWPHSGRLPRPARIVGWYQSAHVRRGLWGGTNRPRRAGTRMWTICKRWFTPLVRGWGQDRSRDVRGGLLLRERGRQDRALGLTAWKDGGSVVLQVEAARRAWQRGVDDVGARTTCGGPCAIESPGSAPIGLFLSAQAEGWVGFAGSLGDFALLRSMGRLEFDPWMCWPGFHHLVDATVSPAGLHVRASPTANVPRIVCPRCDRGVGWCGRAGRCRLFSCDRVSRSNPGSLPLSPLFFPVAFACLSTI